MKKVYVLAHSLARQNAAQAVMQAPDGWIVTVQEKTRSLEQNARYWGNGILAQIARKATVNGQQFSAEAWHEYFKREYIGVVELPDGTVAPKSSSNLSVSEFRDFCMLVEAYAANELGVEFE
jgi:hypothetical protein